MQCIKCDLSWLILYQVKASRALNRDETMLLLAVRLKIVPDILRFFTSPGWALCQLSPTHTSTCWKSCGFLFTFVFSSCLFMYTRYTYSWRSKVWVSLKCTHWFNVSLGLHKYQLPLPSIALAIATFWLKGNNPGIRSPHPEFPPVVMCKMLVHPPIHLVGLKSIETSYCFGSTGMVVTKVFLVIAVSFGKRVKGIRSTGRSERKKLSFFTFHEGKDKGLKLIPVSEQNMSLPPIWYTSFAQEPPLPFLQFVAFPYFWYLVVPRIPAHQPPFCTAKTWYPLAFADL